MWKHRSKKLAVAGAASLAALGAVGTSHAGYRGGGAVYVDQASRYASGSLAEARATSNNTEYIGCYTASYASGTSYIYCFAMSAQNQYVGCYDSESAPNFQNKLQAVQTLNSDSALDFSANAAGGCESIHVQNVSWLRPRGL
jgi:hypothetical protein